MGKKKGVDASSIKLNLTDPCRTNTVPVQWLRDARMAGWVTCCSTVYARVQYREPKTGQLKVKLSWKTKHFAHLCILYIYGQDR